ncbi:hypothetical protein VNO78_27307 [Psophocarpus tetragonolobus]|uniref:TIR domain-containing protein n=1 Tax=Psophocarpus tetragonolobus TaxID=3891 RepID=A0AAN9S0G9_PSOTE
MMSAISAGSDEIAATPGAFRQRWDVFLSFRGSDTREGITKGLYEALEARGVRVFMDDVALERGEEIQRGLMEGIEDSAAFIVVLSENYASSHWCLEELAMICETRKLVIPVFYRVDPRDVRHQSGPFKTNFELHERKYGESVVQSWKKAFKKIGGLSGWPVNHTQVCP